MNVCTSSGLSALGASLGLSQTTGYSPYMPLLGLIIATKWLHFCQVSHYFSFITSDWFLVVVALLTVLDLIVDLIPAVSTGWHALHTAITPWIGGFIAAATAPTLFGQSGISGSLVPGHAFALVLFPSISHLPLQDLLSPILLFVVGFLLAGLVQLHRFGGRSIANVGHVFTLGASNIVISLAEDVLAVLGIIFSLFLPGLMLVIVVISTLFLLMTFKYIRRGWRFLRGNNWNGGSGGV